MKGNREPGTKRNHEIAIRRSYNVEDLSYFGRATVLLAVELEQQTKQTLPSVLPGGSVRGERANFTRLVLGCIEAKFCGEILVGISCLFEKKIEKKGPGRKLKKENLDK